MAANERDYFDIPWIFSVILAIIPVTSCILGALVRFNEGKIVAGLLRIVLGWNVIWFLDLIGIIFKGSIFRILDV